MAGAAPSAGRRGPGAARPAGAGCRPSGRGLGAARPAWVGYCPSGGRGWVPAPGARRLEADGSAGGWAVAVGNETARAAAAGASVAVGMEGGAVARWAAENPRSAALSARARHLFPGGVTHDVRLADPFPLAVARAAGARKWDLDGHELVCYV